MKQVLIKFPDDITDETAINCVKAVIHQGKISKNRTLYCYVTEFSDGIRVSTSNTAKYPTFTIWRKNK